MAAVGFGGTPAFADGGSGVVRVDTGWLRGKVSDDLVTYTGIPYAEPPVGQRRWRPPADPVSWQGIRDATKPGTPCPQQRLESAEDCLYLDVTAPRTRRGGLKPVLVWLYGGAFNTGAAKEFDGARLATSGDVVVVSMNYRLGALGFLSSPVLDGSGGNYGLMDQAAALRWVQRNARRFGGDPGNVTLAGQSAGARAVCAHLASPLSQGLFHRAISQSGACDNDVLTLSAAQAFGAQAIEQLGCAKAADVAACLRGQSVEKLLGTLAGVGFAFNGKVSDRPWNPVAGTPMLPKQPKDVLRDGTGARVPLMIGSTRDEMRMFVSWESNMTAGRYTELVRQTFGERADDVLTTYPVGNYGSPALAMSAVLSDWGGAIGACPVLRTAEAASAHQPVYAYEFAEDSGQVTQTGFPQGSYHGLDLPYLWDLDMAQNPYPPLTAKQKRLSAKIVGYWTAFARTGNPNGPARPHWPEDAVIKLSSEGIAPTPFAADHHCGFWSGISRRATR
ncbi:carboxylesterase/lipase family protein [Actinosynnema sp. ALI-1.44]|uniref:carboxylesterase/lipase family protein n=1 Tax=Actinosynnema sp. ALI-1.44 TaxID=1933779 RepID=UPI00192D0A21|nr:carboxylesterase family protein [Actinosynnema sp. ALI-1.44]